MSNETKATRLEWHYLDPDDDYVKARWLVVDYLQRQIKEQGFNFGAKSFWFNLGVVMDTHHQLVVVTEKKTGQLAGFAVVNFHYKDSAPAIQLIEVVPKFRRNGLGTLLFTLANDLYTECGRYQADEPLFYACSVQKEAEPFFKALGFAPNVEGDWCVKRVHLSLPTRRWHPNPL